MPARYSFYKDRVMQTAAKIVLEPAMPCHGISAAQARAN